MDLWDTTDLQCKAQLNEPLDIVGQEICFKIMWIFIYIVIFLKTLNEYVLK